MYAYRIILSLESFIGADGWAAFPTADHRKLNLSFRELRNFAGDYYS